MNVVTSYHVRPFNTADAESLCAAVHASLWELVSEFSRRMNVVRIAMASLLSGLDYRHYMLCLYAVTHFGQCPFSQRSP